MMKSIEKKMMLVEERVSKLKSIKKHLQDFNKFLSQVSQHTEKDLKNDL